MENTSFLGSETTRTITHPQHSQDPLPPHVKHVLPPQKLCPAPPHWVNNQWPREAR